MCLSPWYSVTARVHTLHRNPTLRKHHNECILMSESTKKLKSTRLQIKPHTTSSVYYYMAIIIWTNCRVQVHIKMRYDETLYKMCRTSLFSG